MKYIYFLSYALETKDYLKGFGNTEVIRDKPIGSLDDINGIVALILEQSPNLNWITILNYQLLRTEDNSKLDLLGG